MAHGTRHREWIAALEQLAAGVVAEMGLELVELTVRGPGKHRVVRVDIDRVGPRGVDIDDCQRVSARLGEALDPIDWLDDGYVLEVSSPGLDRPIETPDDYRRNSGRRVELRTVDPIDGRRLFVGVLLDRDGDCVRLADDESGPIEIAVERIESARQEIGF